MRRATVFLEILRRHLRLRTHRLALVALTALGGCAPALSEPGSPPGTMDAAPQVEAGHDAGTVPEQGGEGPDAIGGDDAPPGDSSDGAETSTGPSPADLVGQWSGTTSQGLSISFTVDAGLDGWLFGWQLPACGSTTSATFPPVPIVDGAVMRSVAAGPGGVSVTMTITFSSSTDATGSIAFTVNPNPAGGCSGSATATFTAHRN